MQLFGFFWNLKVSFYCSHGFILISFSLMISLDWSCIFRTMVSGTLFIVYFYLKVLFFLRILIWSDIRFDVMFVNIWIINGYVEDSKLIRDRFFLFKFTFLHLENDFYLDRVWWFYDSWSWWNYISCVVSTLDFIPYSRVGLCIWDGEVIIFLFIRLGHVEFNFWFWYANCCHRLLI